jgi:2,4-dienoyl-CoA reductase-like NADH-dependent reductase (Old Yellow Enzyme family)
MGNPYFNPHVNRPFAKGGYDHPEHPLYGVYRMLEGIGQIKRAVPEMAVISSGISFLGGGAVGVLAGAIREGWFDMAGFGRQTLAYPDVAKDLVTKGEMDQGRLCLACGKCTEIMRQKGGTPGCVVRDGAVYAPLYRELVLKK